jgi:transcriptional regulator with GAF, ATPase, and Fis domain
MRVESLRKVAAALSQERSLPLLLKHIAAEIGQYRGVALARIWLFEPGLQCAICSAKADARDLPPALHLAASAGRPLKPGDSWGGLDGDFHGGGAKVRRISERNQPLLIRDIRTDREWHESPQWSDEQIRGFAGFPLIFAGAQIGVIGVFSRIKIEPIEFERLRVLSVALAGTIVNTRTAAEIENLRRRLESENAYLRQEASEVAGGTNILAVSVEMRASLDQIDMVAPTDATVLILGETGVGKELVARAIHEGSRRRERPLVKINCTAIPRELFESEFFGHVKGAFSGATGDRKGRFQLGDGGSLFLDEVGDLPLEMQPKLLRVLQDGEFHALGDDHPRHADVRIIAASNRNLKKMVDDGGFREDLYYRLSVFPIEIPPLRERIEDIPVLAAHFIAAACRQFNRPPMQLSTSQVTALRDYEWPGNVRELRNLIERAVIIARGPSLHFDFGALRATENEATRVGAATPQSHAIMTEHEMKRRERENIINALRQGQGKIYGQGGAAELLGTKPTTLIARIKKMRLREGR